MPAPLKATFHVFARRPRSGVLTAAVLVHALAALAVISAFPLLNRDVLEAALYGEDLGPDDGVLVLRMIVSGAALALAYMLVMASLEAACLRWLLREEAGRSGGFSIGADTWRVFAGNLIWFLVASVATVIASILSGLAISLPGLGAEDSLLFVFAGLGTPMAVLLLMLLPLGIGMGAGNAASISRRRFAYFDSWRVSHRRVRSLGGSYLLLWALWFIVFAPALLGIRALLFQRFGVMGLTDTLTEEGQALMIAALVLLYVLSNFAIVFFLAGLNARALEAAIEDGKIEGVSANVAQTFD
ncbi:hypothetical protein [Terricaulis sp.]|uniref:hypothetical protein n=1 Tax=Terricaulis sp. TaxID=2768686 RepID=UPI003783061F